MWCAFSVEGFISGLLEACFFVFWRLCFSRGVSVCVCVLIGFLLREVFVLGKYVSGNGVFKWRRYFIHADKSRLLGGRYGTCIYRKSCRDFYCYFIYWRDFYVLSSSKSLTYHHLFLSVNKFWLSKVGLINSTDDV